MRFLIRSSANPSNTSQRIAVWNSSWTDSKAGGLFTVGIAFSIWSAKSGMMNTVR